MWPFKKKNKGMTPDELAEVVRNYLMPDSSTGISVTPTRAMQCSVFFTCVKILAESVAQLPLILYRRKGDDKKRAVNHNLYTLLHYQPNEWQTAYDFFEFMTGQYVGTGNAYSFINWQRSGVYELLPWRSDLVTVKQNADWSLEYKVSTEDGQQIIPPANMLHIRGLSLNGYTGLNPIAYMREAIGLSLATEKHGAITFKNGARPGGTLTHPKTLSKDATKKLRESWQAAHGGDKQGGTAVLEEGVVYKSITMSAEDSQFLQTRKFQVEDVARPFRIPLHMLQHTEKTTSWGTGIEHMSIGFIKFALLPHLKRWEQNIFRSLLTEKEKKKLFAEFMVEGMERGDVENRYKAYGTAIEHGIMSPNEVRSKENMNAREGGDEFVMALNINKPEKDDKKEKRQDNHEETT
jgi:HK97 family phage portal protein